MQNNNLILEEGSPDMYFFKVGLEKSYTQILSFFRAKEKKANCLDIRTPATSRHKVALIASPLRRL